MFELKGKSYTPERFKLKKWVEFEHIQKQLDQAIRDQNVDEYERKICLLISFAFGVSEEEILDAPWYEQIQLASGITEINNIKHIPLLQKDSTKRPEIKEPWEYEGRTWFWWVNKLAKNYSWNREYIAELDIDEALALLQEILVDEQLQKEWEWSKTEIAYPYNETTKKSKFQPLTRPQWMIGEPVKAADVPKVKILKKMLPVGRIINGEDGSERIVN